MDTEKRDIPAEESADKPEEAKESAADQEAGTSENTESGQQDDFEYVFVDNDEEPEEDIGDIYQPSSVKINIDPKIFISLGGAIVGTVVGVLPSLLCSILLKTLTPILYLPIPLIIYAFIGLLKGYKSTKTTSYVIIFSIIGTYIAGTLHASTLYAAQYNMPLFEIFRVGYYLCQLPAYVYKYMSSGILYGIVFLAFGIYFTIELGLRYEKFGDNAPPIFFKKKAKKAKKTTDGSSASIDDITEDPEDAAASDLTEDLTEEAPAESGKEISWEPDSSDDAKIDVTYEDKAEDGEDGKKD